MEPFALGDVSFNEPDSLPYVHAQSRDKMEPDVTYPLDPDYSICPASTGLAKAIHSLILDVEHDEYGEASGYSFAELEDELSTLDPAKDTWVVSAPSGDLAGYAYIRDRRHVRMDVEGYVHPRHIGRGIGTTLVRLSEARAQDHIALAPDDARVVLHNWVNAGNAAACALMEREGYTPYRYFFRMEMALDGQHPDADWPSSIRVRSCTGEADERVFYETLEDAMSEHWGHIPTSFEEWAERRKQGGFDPSLWFLATEGDEPAGGAICSVSDDVGWVDTLGVRAPWRKQGIGMALLRHAAQALVGRGLGRMALGVDAASPTGATRLYERAGMRIAQQHATYGKELRAGQEVHG